MNRAYFVENALRELAKERGLVVKELFGALSLVKEEPPHDWRLLGLVLVIKTVIGRFDFELKQPNITWTKALLASIKFCDTNNKINTSEEELGLCLLGQDLCLLAS